MDSAILDYIIENLTTVPLTGKDLQKHLDEKNIGYSIWSDKGKYIYAYNKERRYSGDYMVYKFRLSKIEQKYKLEYAYRTLWKENEYPNSNPDGIMLMDFSKDD